MRVLLQSSSSSLLLLLRSIQRSEDGVCCSDVCGGVWTQRRSVGVNNNILITIIIVVVVVVDWSVSLPALSTRLTVRSSSPAAATASSSAGDGRSGWCGSAAGEVLAQSQRRTGVPGTVHGQSSCFSWCFCVVHSCSRRHRSSRVRALARAQLNRIKHWIKTTGDGRRRLRLVSITERNVALQTCTPAEKFYFIAWVRMYDSRTK